MIKFLRSRFSCAMLLCWTLLILASNSLQAQINWASTFSDGTVTAGGFGFADGTVAGTTTVGQLRRDSVNAATGYLNTILDGRGTVNLNWNTSINSTSGILASFGADKNAGINGTFQNGGVYQSARTGAAPFSGADGSGQVNFGSGANWHYAVPGTNTTLPGRIDLVSVLAHEIGHALGFSAYSAGDGVGLGGNTLGATGIYSMMDRNLIRGNVSNTNRMFRTDITNSNYGSYNTAVPVSTYTGGNSSTSTFTNNTTSGLYYDGKFSNEVFNGPIPLYAPGTFNPGSSNSHVNVGPLAAGSTYGAGAIGLMNFNIGGNSVRRFQAYEIAMLMDFGWNVYNWNGTTGNFLDGSTTLANSRWTSDSGIVLAANNSTRYNTNGFQNEAPILPVYGQVTSNIVLNFRGSGSTSYTSTNDIGTVRVGQINFTSTSTGTTTIAGGTFNFGQNSNGTASVIRPKIIQQGSGAVVISSNIQTNNIATQTVDGTQFLGHTGLTVEGTGTGLLTLSGVISGTGGLTKNGSSNLRVTGANTYTGNTTINAGNVALIGASPIGTGNLILNGGTTTATSIAGSVTLNNGNLAPGSSPGILTIGNGLTLTGGTVQIEITGAAAGTEYDQIVVNSGTINLGSNVAKLSLISPTGTFTATTILDLLVNNTGNTINGTFQNVPNGAYVANFDSKFWSVFYNASSYDFGTNTVIAGNNIIIVPVPEPTTIFCFCCAGLAGVSLRSKFAKRKTTSAA